MSLVGAYANGSEINIKVVVGAVVWCNLLFVLSTPVTLFLKWIDSETIKNTLKLCNLFLIPALASSIMCLGTLGLDYPSISSLALSMAFSVMIGMLVCICGSLCGVCTRHFLLVMADSSNLWLYGSDNMSLCASKA